MMSGFVLTENGGKTMDDREKVIKGLEKLRNDLGYGLPDRSNVVIEYLNSLTDAITLLEEHEPALPTWSQGKAYCGKCGHRLPRKRADREINYCCHCGQAVKWNE